MILTVCDCHPRGLWPRLGDTVGVLPLAVGCLLAPFSARGQYGGAVEIFDRLRAANGGTLSGFFDVFAWREPGQVGFYVGELTRLRLQDIIAWMIALHPRMAAVPARPHHADMDFPNYLSARAADLYQI